MFVEEVEDDAVDREQDEPTPLRQVARRITFNLPPDSYNQLFDMAARRHLTLVEMVRQAIADKAYLEEVLLRGGAIETIEPDGSRTRVVFH